MLVACLCAEWCGTCREFRDVFLSLTTLFPAAQFSWIDIEEQAELVSDLDIQDFPSLVIYQGMQVVFFGTILPSAQHLARLLQAFIEVETAQEFALSSAEQIPLNVLREYLIKDIS